jgi:hypothetical protein
MWEALASKSVAVPEICNKDQGPEYGLVLWQPRVRDIIRTSELLAGLIPATSNTEQDEHCSAS